MIQFWPPEHWCGKALEKHWTRSTAAHNKHTACTVNTVNRRRVRQKAESSAQNARTAHTLLHPDLYAARGPLGALLCTPAGQPFALFAVFALFASTSGPPTSAPLWPFGGSALVGLWRAELYKSRRGSNAAKLRAGRLGALCASTWASSRPPSGRDEQPALAASRPRVTRNQSAHFAPMGGLREPS